MKTNLYFNPEGLKHDTGPGHPERPARLQTVLDMTSQKPFDTLPRITARRATEEEITRAHPENYFYHIESLIPESGYVALDADTTVSPGSWDAALTAAGGVCQAVDDILAGKCTRAFCAVRPPGHHAEPQQAMGFCLFNNIAIGAQHARAVHGLKRIAVVDFDVHHGNGTQAAFERDPDLFYASTHQSPLYPGTGQPYEHGVANNIVNAPLAPSSGSVEFRQAMERSVLPALDSFAPELLLISAGFDAHLRDPLAGLNLVEEDYAWVTRKLCEIADRHAKSRVVSALEGGYDLRALAASVAAHVDVLMAG